MQSDGGNSNEARKKACGSGKKGINQASPRSSKSNPQTKLSSRQNHKNQKTRPTKPRGAWWEEKLAPKSLVFVCLQFVCVYEWRTVGFSNPVVDEPLHSAAFVVSCQCATVEPSKFFAKLQHILQKRDVYIYIYIVLASRSLWLEEERERNTDAVSPDLTARMQGPDLPCRFLAGGSVLSTCVGKKHGV
jgi:hypothetical protein